MAAVTNITESDFAELVAPLIGREIAAVWLADYTALYLELGAIVGSYDSGRLRAEYCVYLGFDWEFEAEPKSCLSSSEPDAKVRIEDLVSDQRIAGVSATATLELELLFKSGARIRSSDVDADPAWTIHLPSDSCLGAEANSLVVQTEAAPVVA